MTSILQDDVNELAHWQGQAEMLSIYHAMQQLSDTRRKQGKRYSLPLVLTYLLRGLCRRRNDVAGHQ